MPPSYSDYAVVAITDVADNRSYIQRNFLSKGYIPYGYPFVEHGIAKQAFVLPIK
jgi:hypothetical protein